MDTKQMIGQYCRQFKLAGIPGGMDQLVREAEKASIGYLEYTAKLLATEARHREDNDIKKGRAKTF